MGVTVTVHTVTRKNTEKDSRGERHTAKKKRKYALTNTSKSHVYHILSPSLDSYRNSKPSRSTTNDQRPDDNSNNNKNTMNETTPLTIDSNKKVDAVEDATEVSSHSDGLDRISSSYADFAKGDHKMMTKLLGYTQATLLILFFFATSYSSNDYVDDEYVIFRDIMVMLLLGFGFLMTFLSKYGLGAVGFTMLMTVLAIQLNIFVEWVCRIMYNLGGGGGGDDADDTSFPLNLRVPTLIDGEFAAATLLITFGAIIG